MTAAVLRRAAGAARAAMLAAGVAAIPDLPMPPQAQPIEIRINDERVGTGLAWVEREGAPVEPLLALRDLRRGVDGVTAPGASRLQVRGGALYAIATGGCDGCLLAVERRVQISSDLRSVDGATWIPLRDVARALEGRVEADRAAGRYVVRVGRCDWCVLGVRR